jgi:regulator of protease activity HflC (stomatin/prohibitin superfamily)
LSLILLAAFIIICILVGVRMPQSEKFVVERFGRLRAVLGPGINFIGVPPGRVPSQDFDPADMIAGDEPDAITS